MKRWVTAGAVMLAILGCADFSAPGTRTVSLSIVPVFDANAVFANNADRLRVRIQRDSLGIFVAVLDTVLAIDADGNVSADVNVVLFQSPQVFKVLLDAIRTSDNAILYSGNENVTVTNTPGAAPQEVAVTVSYQGVHGARVVIAPKDTSVASGAAFSFRATVFDESNTIVPVPVTFFLVNAADASKLTLNRISGAANAPAGQQGQVLVYVVDQDGHRDTATVFVGSVAATVRVTPGYGNVALSQTLQFTGTVLDAGGNTMSGQTLTWTSRSPGVATVSSSGLVSGVGSGGAVIVASNGSLADSVRVTVPTAGNVIVSSTSNDRAFRHANVGQTVVVDLTADMRFTPSEKLGSYGATITWDPAKLSYIDVQAGDFPAPVVNAAGASSGTVALAQANANGSAGVPILAKIRFQALAAGNAGVTVTITELSGSSPTYTNLFSASRVTVTNGNVTVH